MIRHLWNYVFHSYTRRDWGGERRATYREYVKYSRMLRKK
jgi:hypothetical protein